MGGERGQFPCSRSCWLVRVRAALYPPKLKPTSIPWRRSRKCFLPPIVPHAAILTIGPNMTPGSAKGTECPRCCPLKSSLGIDQRLRRFYSPRFAHAFPTARLPLPSAGPSNRLARRFLSLLTRNRKQHFTLPQNPLPLLLPDFAYLNDIVVWLGLGWNKARFRRLLFRGLLFRHFRLQSKHHR